MSHGARRVRRGFCHPGTEFVECWRVRDPRLISVRNKVPVQCTGEKKKERSGCYSKSGFCQTAQSVFGKNHDELITPTDRVRRRSVLNLHLSALSRLRCRASKLA